MEVSARHLQLSSYHARRGHRYGVVGSNGSGKTTLMARWGGDMLIVLMLALAVAVLFDSWLLALAQSFDTGGSTAKALNLAASL